jgi:hypothetical protein
MLSRRGVAVAVLCSLSMLCCTPRSREAAGKAHGEAVNMGGAPDRTYVLDSAPTDGDIYLDWNDPIPQYDVQVGCQESISKGDSILFYWQTRAIGEGADGLQRLLAEVRRLPRGTRVLVHPEWSHCSMPGGSVFQLSPWDVGGAGTALERTAHEKRLILIHSPRDSHGILGYPAGAPWPASGPATNRRGIATRTQPVHPATQQSGGKQ